MEIVGRSLRRRVLDAFLPAVCLLAVTAVTDGGIEWTLVLVGLPAFFLLELLGDVVGRRIREWRAT